MVHSAALTIAIKDQCVWSSQNKETLLFKERRGNSQKRFSKLLYVNEINQLEHPVLFIFLSSPHVRNSDEINDGHDEDDDDHSAQ